jgi:glycosyltransferase involved in cell wall biosynthesis
MLDKFVLAPSVTTMRKLYSGAKFLLKASRYEGRSCAPVEAMACGTTCVRGLIEGDDDLIDNATCLRRPYDLKLVRDAADLMMTDDALYDRLTENASIYVDEFLDWSKIISCIEIIYGV